MAGVEQRPIKVMVVDDEEVIRETIGDLIRREKSLELIGVADDGRAAVALARERPVDVVLMDINMPVMDGYQATRFIREAKPSVAVLMLTSIEDDAVVVRSAQAGSAGMLLKSSDQSAIVDSIHAASRGVYVLSASPTHAILGSLPVPSEDIRLTRAEKKVLGELCDTGNSNGEIAITLSVSEGNVKKHVSELMRKLGASSRAQVILIALREGLVPLPIRPRT